MFFSLGTEKKIKSVSLMVSLLKIAVRGVRTRIPQLYLCLPLRKIDTSEKIKSQSIYIVDGNPTAKRTFELSINQSTNTLFRHVGPKS